MLQAIGGLLGRNSQNRAETQANEASQQASRESTQANWSALGVNAQLQDPFRMAGLGAQNEYLQMMGMAPVESQSAQQILSGYNPMGQRLRDPNATGDPEAMLHDGTVGNHANWLSQGSADYFDPRTGNAIARPPTVGGLPTTAGSPGAGGAMSTLPTTGYTADQVMARLQRTPGYQTRATEGRTQIEAGAASRGGLNSGAALRALTRYGQDYNTSEYDRYMNRLSGLFGGAQQATNQVSGAAGQFGQTAGNNAMAAGNSRANMYRNQGQNNAGFYGGLAQAANQNMNSFFGGM